jgi:hypothetical protein
MAKHLAEHELRRQAVQALSDRLGPVKHCGFLRWFLASPSTVANSRMSIFRTIAWIN